MRKLSRSRQSGFTLIEIMVVSLIALILLTFGLPALRQILLRSSLETTTQQFEATFRRARYSAIREGSPVVIQALPADRGLRTYTDVPVLDANGNRTDTALVYSPVAGAGRGTTDRILEILTLPQPVDFRAPAALQVVDGFTNISGGPPASADPDELVAVFLPDGSIQDIGTLRIGDNRGNFFQFDIEIAATGRVVLSKFDCGDSNWYERLHLDTGTNTNESVSRWRWYLSPTGAC